VKTGDTFNLATVARSLRIPVLITVGLLAAFYAGVGLLPRVVHALAARSLYNYRDLVDRAVARGDWDGAVAVIERAAREIPREIYFERPEFMYERLGRIRQEQGGHVAESLEAFLRAQACYFRNIRLQGYAPPPRLIRDIIRACFEMDNPEGAYHEARFAMDLYPLFRQEFLKGHLLHAMEDPRIMRDLGLLELKQGNLASGTDRLNQSLVRNPRLPETHYWLGRFAEDLQQPEKAVQEYEAELANWPYSENAYTRLVAIYEQLHRDPAYINYRCNEVHQKALAQYPSATSTTGQLAALLIVGSKVELAFDLPEPGNLAFIIVANSTPCYDVWGWFEFALDDRHIQTIYADSPEVRGYTVQVNGVEAGHHTFRIENLSDAADGHDDRNVILYNVRVYRLS